MADNTVLNAGSGGDTLASDDIGGVKHPRSKISVGADGAASDAIPVSNGLDTTATGVLAAGMVAQFDDVSVGTVTENQFAPVRISSRRALLVEGVASGTVIPVSDGGGALTVDGTVSVSGTVTVDGSGVTQPISHAALTELAAAIDTELQVDVVGALPAGTNNIGDVDVLSIAAGDNNIGNVDIASIAAGDNNIGNVDIVSLPASTNTLEVVGDAAHDAAVAGNPLLIGFEAKDQDGSALPNAVNAEGDVVRGAASLSGVIYVMPVNEDGSNTASLNNIATIGTSVTPGTAASNLGKAEDAAHTTGDVGVMALAVRAAAPTERSAGPTDGDYEPLGVNEVGALWVSVTPSANGGATTMNASSSDGGTALTSTVQAIKASAGTLKGYYIYNPNATAQFVQFYNTASGSVTVGTTNPLFMLTIPATSAANLWMPDGIAFATAMSWAATSTAGGNGAPTTALDAVAWYK